MSVSASHVEAAAASAPAKPAPAEEQIELVIKPRRGWTGVDWRELIRYRELFYFLVWRDVKVKYKQAILGIAWAVFVPVISTLIYSVIGWFMGFDKRIVSGVPYPIWMYAGLIPWIFLQASISAGGMSLVSQQALMSKIYLPRLFIPASSCGSALVDMLLSFAVFALMLVVYQHVPSWQIVYLPLLMLLMFVMGMGLAFLLSAATVMYRDLRFLIPFLTQIGIWLTAVAYPSTIFDRSKDYFTNQPIPGGTNYEPWLALNPLAGIVSGFRSAIVGEPWKPPQLISAVIGAVLIFFIGLFYFRRVERRFADIA
jgi:lipopolysaccharide transport system permease protein